MNKMRKETNNSGNGLFDLRAAPHVCIVAKDKGYLSALNDVEVVPDVALADDDVALGHGLPLHGVNEHGTLLFGEVAEDEIFAKRLV